jgi:hypothetical protein
LHPVGTFNAVFFIFVYTILLILKYRKLPFSLKRLFIAVTIFLVLAIALDPVHFMDFFSKSLYPSEKKDLQINNLFHFSKYYESGYPNFWFDFNRTIGPWWMIIFLLLGVGFLLLRRRKKDLVLLAWLFGLYLFLQFLMYHEIGRYVRNVIEIGHIFYVLIAIGAVYLTSFFKIPSRQKRFIKLGVIIFVAILAINSIGKAAYETLSTAYNNPLQRPNKHQFEAAEWMHENLEPTDDVFDVYTWLIERNLNNRIWIQTIAQRQVNGVKLPWQNNTYEGLDGVYYHDANYVLVDYSRLIIANAQSQIMTLRQWEDQFMENESLVYDKNDIRIYKLRDIWYADKERDHTSTIYGADSSEFIRQNV